MKDNNNRLTDKLRSGHAGTLPEGNYNTNKTNLYEHTDSWKKGKQINTKVASGALTGAAIGAVVGSIISVLSCIATDLVIPGFGIVMAAPVAAGMAGAGAGIISGGMIGALLGSEIAEENASLYNADREEKSDAEENGKQNEKETGYFERWWRAGGDEELYL